MKKTGGYKELYDDIIKSFYFGEYNKDDQFMTQLEAKDHYGIARNSVERVFKMLQQDGLLLSQGNRGTFVTFDRGNPAHMAKVPLSPHNPDAREFHTFSLPVMILSGGLYGGLTCSTPPQLDQYCRDTLEILDCIDAGRPCAYLVSNLFFRIMSRLDNPYLLNIISHFWKRYFYFNRTVNLSLDSQARFGECFMEFQPKFVDMIQRGDFDAVRPLIREFYEDVYRIPGALMFSPVGRNAQVFKEQFQYGKLFYSLLISIHADGLKKGDSLPTIAELRARYHVSEKTARKAYDLLSGVGLVSRKQRVGSRLALDLDDPVVRQWSLAKFVEQQTNLTQMLEALMQIGWDIARECAAGLSPAVLDEMRAELRRQHARRLKNRLPYFVSDVMITPMVMSLPVCALQSYYFYVQRPAAEFFGLYGTQFGLGLKENDEVYSHMTAALDHLARRETAQFAQRAAQAQQLNANSVTRACIQKISSWVPRDGFIKKPPMLV